MLVQKKTQNILEVAEAVTTVQYASSTSIHFQQIYTSPLKRCGFFRQNVHLLLKFRVVIWFGAIIPALVAIHEHAKPWIWENVGYGSINALSYFLCKEGQRVKTEIGREFTGDKQLLGHVSCQLFLHSTMHDPVEKAMATPKSSR